MPLGMDDFDDLLEDFGTLTDVEPEVREMLPKGYLSPSSVSTFLMCGERFRLTYIEGFRSPSSGRMFQGTTVHSAVEAVLRERLKSGKIPKAEMATDTFATLFEANKMEVGDWEGETPAFVKDTGISCAKVYMQEVVATTTPVAIERTYRTEIVTKKGLHIPMLGRTDSVQVQSHNEQEYQDIREKVVAQTWVDPKTGLDALPRVSKPLRLHDLKVVTKKWSKDKAKNSLQMALYAGAEHVPDVQVDQLVKGEAKIPRPRYEPQTAVMTNHDVQHAVNVVERVAESIMNGYFTLTDPSNWCCSEKYCGVWKQCRGKNT